VNATLARRVDTGRRTENVWVAPGAGTVCLLALDPAGPGGGYAQQCRAPNDVAAGRLFITYISGRDPTRGPTTVYGVVPDGVRRVTVTDDDGTRRTVGVRDNVYAVHGGRARWVEFDTPAGRQRTRV
jgi:hypothetical protein